MKKIYYTLPALLIVILILFIVISNKTAQEENPPAPANENSNQKVTQEEKATSLANPASKYCEKNGGKLEIVTESDGAQFGLCKFEDYSCEEWAYFKGECTIDEDAEKIKQALIAKGLNLTDMKVVIHKHLGKYIGGGVVPISVPAGGGYVFAVKEDDKIKILADGNGSIMCRQFEDYPDFPAYLVPECVDESGTPIMR